MGAWTARSIRYPDTESPLKGVLTFTSDGSFVQELRNFPRVEGTWKIDGHTVLITRKYAAEPVLAELADNGKTLLVPGYDEEHGSAYTERYTRSTESP